VLSLGCAGTIDGTAGFFPKSVVYLYELSINEKLIELGYLKRRELQYKISAVEELVVRYGTVGIKEAISRILQFGDRDGTRLPLCGGIPGGDSEWENWKDVIGELETVEKSLPII
jgi:2-keto-3-deoxy-L-rhamnonate aldolase